MNPAQPVGFIWAGYCQHCVGRIHQFQVWICTDIIDSADSGLDTLSVHAGGRGVKVWLLWPDTQENRLAFAPLRGLHQRTDLTVQVISQMKDLRLAMTDKNRGLFFPSGWFHSVMTLEGGFLVGTNVVFSEHACRAAEWIAEEIRLTHIKPSELRGCIETVLRAITNAPRAENGGATESSYRAFAMLLRIDMGRALHSQLIEAWKAFKAQLKDYTACYVCGKEGLVVATHIAAEYLRKKR